MPYVLFSGVGNPNLLEVYGIVFAILGGLYLLRILIDRVKRKSYKPATRGGALPVDELNHESESEDSAPGPGSR